MPFIAQENPRRPEGSPGLIRHRSDDPSDAGVGGMRMPFIAQEQSGDHLGVSGWIVVMSFRSEAFRLNFRHVQFWRGCLRFLLERRQPFA